MESVRPATRGYVRRLDAAEYIGPPPAAVPPGGEASLVRARGLGVVQQELVIVVDRGEVGTRSCKENKGKLALKI